MIEYLAPTPMSEMTIPRGHACVFLAGSIDNGKAREWQRELVRAFETADVVFLNPRRRDWNSALEPVASNPEFREQVEWELASLELADIVVFYFDPKGIAPVSMLELGLHARGKTVIVCCPDGFFRQGNIEIVCERYGVEFMTTFPELLTALRRRLR